MLRVLNAAQMQATDRYTIEQMQVPSMVLMEKAAEAMVAQILSDTLEDAEILVVCGSGNNGADGMAAARMLYLKGRHVALYLAGQKSHFTKEASKQWQIARNYGVPVINNPQLDEYTVLVDALFGTGLSRAVTGTYATLIRQINITKARVYAMDIPSGVNATTGQIMQTAVQADCTVTFSFYKLGTLLYPGAACCGKLVLADAGIYPMDTPYQPDIRFLEKTDLCERKKRCSDGNKGTFGKVLLIAGSEEICGAAYMSARSAFLCGAGMVRIYTPAVNCQSLHQLLPEAMTTVSDGADWEVKLENAIDWADVIGIGPGIGTNKQAQAFVEKLLTYTDKPLVLDADALNILSKYPDWLARHRGCHVLTPHMGEMSRLTGHSISCLKEDPCRFAMQAAADYQAVCVLKDARTCIALPDQTVYLHCFGNSGMATAGSGDVLTGTILGLYSSCTSLAQAAYLGVLLHGLAGDKAADRHGEEPMTAMDICRKLPHVLKLLSEKHI